jgi:thiamine-phosphate pyrophosphorylase
VKCLYVTDRRAIGDDAFRRLLRELSGAKQLTVELREKESADREVLAWARSAKQELGPEVPVLVNRRLDVALAAGADGVHLPADGLPLPRIRAAAPRGTWVGVSTHSAAEAIRAIEEQADVVVIGPIFQTPSKTSYGPPLGTRSLEDLPPRGTHGAEVFAIGGIDESRLEELARFGDRISGVAAVRLVQHAADARAVVERIGSL